MNNYIDLKMNWGKKLALFLGAGLLVLSACGTEADSKESASKLESKVKTVDSSDAEEEAEEVAAVPIESFYSYWTNEDYSYFLDAERLFVYNQTTEDSHRYLVDNQEVNDNTLEINFQDGAKLELTMNGSELEVSGNDQMLYTEAPFTETTMEQLEIPFLIFVENDGVLTSYERDLTLADFEGYWAPFNATEAQLEFSPIGAYLYYLSENLHVVAYFGSEAASWFIQDYEINGNTMTLWMENADIYDYFAYTEGALDHFEMELVETKITLFEDEDRDRLVFHENGYVLQRMPEDELRATTILGQSGDNYFVAPQAIEQAASIMAQIPESDLTVHRKTKIDEGLQLENYPYSLGELSEEQLFKEQMIVKGRIANPEESVSEEEAFADLLARNYASTPALNVFEGKDIGYAFSEQLVLSQGGLGSYVLTLDGRGEVEGTQSTFEVREGTFEDHLYTLDIKEVETAEMGKKYFYRVNAEILYELDADGNILGRYETGTDWQDFEGMPER